MPDSDPTKPTPPSPELHGLDAGELLARGLATAMPSGGASAWEPPTPEELAKLLPQYRIESLLGRGGMGAVYKGVQAALDRPVAIKLLPAEVAANGDFLARFQREARTLAKLQHSGIVAVYDFGQTGEGHLYFVMEYVDGTDLQHILKGPGLKPEQAFVLIGQICEALHYAHQQGVIHRDIKPANILVTKDGRAKVADFGLARPLIEESGGLTQTNMLMGTPDYMAPEQRTGVGHPDHRADIFALGVMLYEMLTGQRPHGAFQPPSHRVQVDVRIDEVVLKALQQEPDRRYQQASEMKVDVDRIRTTPPRPAKPKRGKLLIAGSIILGGVLLLVAFLFVFNRPRVGPVRADDRPALVWQRLDPTAVEWQAMGKTVKDGWVQFPVTTDKVSFWGPAYWGPSKTKLPAMRDVAIRVRYRWTNEKNPQTSIELKAHGGRTGPYPFVTLFNASARLSVALRKNDNLGDFVFPKPLETGHEGSLELAVIGDRIIVRVDGRVTHDKSWNGLASQRGFEIKSVNCWLRDFEFINLDGIADPLKALGWDVPATTIPPVGAASSKDAITVPASGDVRTFAGHRYLFVSGQSSWPEAKAKAEDMGGHLATFENEAELQWVAENVARPKFATESRQMWVGGKKSSQDTPWQWVTGEPWPEGLPMTENISKDPLNGSYPAFAKLLYLYHTIRLFDASDSAVGNRNWRNENIGFIVEWDVPATTIPPAAASSSASIATATKEAPFVNTLGMKFVPVPITSGPSGGQRVLFSVWETRVQDYEVFAKETKRDWPKAGFEQGPTHPAVMVSWEDAQSFCAWLTARERKAGNIGNNERYRLPSDHEWSCAAGIGDREDATKTPRQKLGGIQDALPWGTNWPPPVSAGNYAGEEMKPLFDQGKYPLQRGLLIVGRNDGYPETAPVGSFASNSFGLFDLGGNAMEWCEDLDGDGTPNRTARGSEWRNGLRHYLLSSQRDSLPPTVRIIGTGFRCVLAPATSTPPAAIAPAAAASSPTPAPAPKAP